MVWCTRHHCQPHSSQHRLAEGQHRFALAASPTLVTRPTRSAMRPGCWWKSCSCSCGNEEPADWAHASTAWEIGWLLLTDKAAACASAVNLSGAPSDPACLARTCTHDASSPVQPSSMPFCRPSVQPPVCFHMTVPFAATEDARMFAVTKHDF